MQIQGPLNIRVVDNSDAGTRELQLSFTNEFQQQPHDVRINEFRDYMTGLHKDIHSTDDPASQQGMMTILQISEQILPHLESDEIPLEETIIIEIGPSSPFDQLLSKATLK